MPRKKKTRHKPDCHRLDVVCDNKECNICESVIAEREEVVREEMLAQLGY